MKGELISDKETIVSPEEIWGQDYRVPKIIRERDIYQIEGLGLPLDWQEAIPRMKAPGVAGFSALLQNVLAGKEYGWELRVDSQTGLITKVSLDDNRNRSSVVLDEGVGFSEGASYRGEEISDLPTAIVYLEFLASYLSYISGKQNYSYIINGAGPGRCGSVHLAIPKVFCESKKKVTSEHYQDQFEVAASNIAGQFGLTLAGAHFNEQGLLQYFQIEEGNACDYGLADFPRGEYAPHNVDDPWQAAALHGIGAKFINDLLERLEDEEMEKEDREKEKTRRKRVSVRKT